MLTKAIKDISSNMRGNIKDRLTLLIKKYEEVKRRGLLKRYDESNTRKDFILPLFEILGWDIRNREEVTSEAPASKGRVDYAFRISGIPKFFLETKALKVDLDLTRWAEQVINYAWHKGVIWAVLSDFEAIKVFNAEWLTKSPEESLFFEIRWDEYLKKFDQLWLLSKESFLENRLDKEAEKWGKKRRKAPVDEELLKDMMNWRKMLAVSIRKNRQKYSLSQEEIDEAIQRILDRLIFIRTCEDRGIEPPILQPLLRESLTRKSSLISKPKVSRGDSLRRGLPYERSLVGQGFSLARSLRKIFRDFDSGYNSQLFTPHLCEELIIDDKVLIEIVKGLYETRSKAIRYDFSAIDADVLGSMYEQYLGHILKETPKRATLKEQPRRRKEMGIYYTPKYIVDYIVKNTVGALLKEKPYRKAVDMKILDPACGSGSFLIRAFEEMDNYLREKRTQRGAEFDYFRRMDILRRNLYGVDLDRQAVEIARLNLLLKALERRGSLPKLKNIRQGNSLISGTADELKKYFGKDYQSKHPFNWEEEFPEVFKKGGFDVVIGNPPYVNIKEIQTTEKEFYRQHFRFAIEQFDLYTLLMEKAYYLLKPGGYFSYIIPDAILSRSNVKEIRKFLLSNTSIVSLMQVSGVFADPSVASVVIVYQKRKPSKAHATSFIKSKSLDALTLDRYDEVKASPSVWTNFPESRIAFMEKGQMQIVKKISCGVDKVPLGKLVFMTRGEELGKKSEKITGTRLKKTRPFLVGENVAKYRIEFSNRYIKESEIKKPKENYFAPKIIVRQLGTNINAALDEDGKYVTIQSIYSLLNRSPYSLKYLLGLLNSGLMDFYYRMLFGTKQLFPRILLENLKQLPIHKINFSNPKEKKMHDELVKLADKMLDLNKRLVTFGDKLTDERCKIKIEIQNTNKKINKLVYQLYGITDKEKEIIERET